MRDGDRELEVSGSAVFVRQVLDDLASLWPRLHGANTPTRPASISMPAPAPREQPRASKAVESNGDSLDERVLAVLKRAERPLAVAAIRKRLADNTSPQQVRRALERNTNRVAVVDERPATYRLR
jgi:hypothetical protein